MQYISTVRTNTLSSRIVPESWLTNILLVVAGSAFMALSGRFSHTFAFSTVPITGQTFAVLLIGAVYGSRLGAATMIAYLAEGAAGLPVFSAGAGGISAISTVSGGYLFGFIIAAYVVGFFAERGADRSRWIVLPMLLASALIYIPGIVWLHQWFDVNNKPITWSTALDFGLWPFIAGDLAKVVAASLAVPAGWEAVERVRRML